VRLPRLILAALLVAAVAAAHASPSLAQYPVKPDVVSVGGAAPVAPIPVGFLGLSFEYQSAATYAGGSPTTIDPVFEQLVRNLNPGGSPVLRVGGDSTDHTWWPTKGVADSPGLTYPLTSNWISTMATLADQLGANLLLGINMEANNPKLAAAEADGLVNGIGSSHVQALELGNEPELYGSFPWYTTTKGKAVPGRAGKWTFSRYLADYARIRAALPDVPLAGPDLGTPSWMGGLSTLLKQEPRIGEVTFHRYPEDRCYASPGTSAYASVPNLLSATASRGLAATIEPYAAVARAHGDGFRVDEMNSVACAGKAGVSNTFASALWILDTLFAMADEGATGVNIHTFPSASYRLFNFSRPDGQWSATVAPEYYGLQLFTQAAPPGSRLLKVTATADTALRAWATADSAATTRVVLINDSTSQTHDVEVRRSGSGSPAVVERLAAPSAYATSGVTLAGLSYGTTTTGVLAGTPQVAQVDSTSSGYPVTLPPASAALLTIPAASTGASVRAR